MDRNCLPGRGNVGFDFFYGIPYSHEEGYPGPFPESLVFPPVPLMTNGYNFIEQPFNMSDLTARYYCCCSLPITTTSDEWNKMSMSNSIFYLDFTNKQLKGTPQSQRTLWRDLARDRKGW